MKGSLQRILMTADTVGGVWPYALELAGAMAVYDIEIILATMGNRLSGSQWEEVRKLKNVKVRQSTFKLEWMSDPWQDIEDAGDWLLELENEFEPDLIHLNGYAHVNLPWHAPKLVVGHSCVLSWWRAVKGKDAPAEYERYENVVRAGLRAADYVVAPTRAMMRCLFDHYGPFENAVVIPNGRALEKYGPARKENFVLSAGRLWDEAKNVRAVCACSLELPWLIRVAGDVDHPDGGSEEVTSQTAEQGTKWLGKLSEAQMADWFGRASIYALPAKYEPFGLSILEAALSGCAFFLGDIPSLRENWNGAALFVDPNDIRQIRTLLLELIENPSQRTALATRARERGRQFNITETASLYWRAYQSLSEMDRIAEEGSLAVV